MLIQNIIRAAAAGALGLGLAACNTLPVVTDVNPNMSVSNCHTYAFAQEHMANANQPAAYGNPLNAERLRVAIAANLAARGIQPADRSVAECVVGYAMGTRQVFNDYYSSFGAGWGYGGGGYGWGRRGGLYGGWGWDGPYVRDETRIAVDLFDAKSRTPIWHASVSQSVADLTGPNAEARISAGTAAIFAKFPIAVPLPATGRTTT
jgi:alpha-glucuronidase